MKPTHQPASTKARTNRPLGSFCVTIAALMISQNGLHAQEVIPLVTPEVLPSGETKEADETGETKKPPTPELGFPGAPVEGQPDTSTGDIFETLPAVSDAGIQGDYLDPSIPIDPIPLEGSLLDEIPLEMQDTQVASVYENSFPTAGFDNMYWGSADPRYRGGQLSGFSNAPIYNPLGGGLLGTVREGLSASATLSGTYSTNPSQGFSTPASSGQGDFSMSLGGGLNYRSTASTWTYGLSYSGSYSQYFDQTDLSGYNQSAGANLNYDGGPLTASLGIAIGFGSGANRNYGAIVDELSYSYSLGASYAIGAKTSLSGSFSQNLSSASGGVDTSSFSAGLSAMYRYSPSLQFGPGVSYSRSGGDAVQQDRTSIGPTLSVNYVVTDKVSLSSQVGMNFADYGNGGSADPSLSTSIAMNYRATDLWGMNLSLSRDVSASRAGLNEFEETTGLRLGYNRSIRRATWNLGVGWNFTTAENPEGTPTTRPDRNYLSLDTSLSMPIFANTTSASIFMGYSDQSSDGGAGANESFNSFQMGFSLSRGF